MESNALERARIWASNQYFDDAFRKEIQDLIDSGDEKEIIERFYCVKIQNLKLFGQVNEK